jgi:WD domain, G-beta repeat
MMTYWYPRICSFLVAGTILCSATLLLAGPASAPLPQNTKSTEAQKSTADDKTIRDLIQKLGDDSFENREDAAKKLVAIGDPALELLRQAAKDSTDAEIRQRSEKLTREIRSLQLSLVRILGESRKMTAAPMKRVEVTPDGKKVVACGSLGCYVLDIESGNELLFCGEVKQNAFALGLSPDSRRLLAGSPDHKVVRLYDLDTGKKLLELKGHTDTVWGALFLPGGKQALTGSWDSSIRVWDLKTGVETRAFVGVRDKVRCLALAPDGKTVVAGQFTRTSGPGTVRLWDVETGKEIKSLEGHTAEVSSVAFSPDGKMLLSSSFDKTIRLWDVATGKELRRMTGQPMQSVEYAVFTPDGKRIVSCGVGGQGSDFALRSWTVRVWDVASGKQLLESDDITGGALGVAVHPDGQRCVTASRDGLVRLWQ